MTSFRVRASFGLGLFVTLAMLGAACGNPSNNSLTAHPPVGDGGADTSTVQPLGDDSGPTLGGATLTSIAIQPAQVSLTVLNGMGSPQTFTATGTFSDGSTSALATGLTWSADNSPVGAIAGGVYTPSGAVGGLVNVTLAYNGQTAHAQLTVKLHLTDSSAANVPPASRTALTGATMPDPTVVWAYPYNGTVFPRGLNAPLLMWNGSAAGDLYYVQLNSSTFEYETFTTADPPSQLALPEPVWDAFVGSTNGAATLQVSRLTAANVATVVTNLGWTIAPAALRGTVYYWANNLGRVERLQPGATMPDDFADVAPLTDTSVYPSSSCLMTCHTVSANGSVIISGGGSFGGSYSLTTGQPMYSLGGVWGGTAGDQPSVIQWSGSALTPDGAYVVENQLASQLSQAVNGPAISGMFKTADGSAVAQSDSGLTGDALFMPAFSPDGSKMLYVAGAKSVPGDWITSTAPGALRVMPFNESASPMLSPATDLVQPMADPTYFNITWPTVSPDGRWVLYSRLNSDVIDSRGNCGATCDYSTLGDLYLADTTMPNTEVRLAALNGDGYPFAAGSRDLHYNYEPTFAPVAAGGYFWVVFTSRRTYGNSAAGAPSAVKQLWVAAINQTSPTSENPNSPTLLMDPSHPPFLLPGQGASLNMRGYFALPPCKNDGISCNQGTDCCGGYCVTPTDADAGADAGADGGSGLSCASVPNGCSQDGNHCAQTSDCCGASSGVTCINSVCSEAPPQ